MRLRRSTQAVRVMRAEPARDIVIFIYGALWGLVIGVLLLIMV